MDKQSKILAVKGCAGKCAGKSRGRRETSQEREVYAEPGATLVSEYLRTPAFLLKAAVALQKQGFVSRYVDPKEYAQDMLDAFQGKKSSSLTSNGWIHAHASNLSLYCGFLPFEVARYIMLATKIVPTQTYPPKSAFDTEECIIVAVKADWIDLEVWVDVNNKERSTK